mgnify:CR=1 FL=1
MPNWCSNHVSIKHDDIDKINLIEEELQKDDPQLFNLLVPQPDDIGDGWYGWNCANWGTKWDASVGDFERVDDNTISINMDTAWSPPIGVYEALYEQGYEVLAYYLEEGMAFAGKYEDGMDWYYEYGNGQELPEDIDEYWGISERQAEYDREAAYEEWLEECKELETTDWLPSKIKPVHTGVYETQTKSWPYPNKNYWDGEKWCFYNWYDNEPTGEVMNKIVQWRGITENQNSDLNNLKKALEELKAEFDAIMAEENNE